MKEHNKRVCMLYGAYDQHGNLQYMCWEVDEGKARTRLLLFYPEAALIKRIR